MKKQRKKYEVPKRPWDKERLEKERKIMKDYGLKKKKELWRAEAILRKYRRIARDLTAKRDKEKEKELIKKLNSLGLLDERASLDDVLSLTVENILERRLQTIVFRKGLANTIKHARQLIVHGHVFIDGRKVLYPSYIVRRGEEGKIEVKVK
ncbi:MAG: 30S ribosomal protein S4 [Candidatus Aenigmatarchaeota archaeon]